MRNIWQNKRVGDLCEVIAGQSPEGKFYNTEGEGTPFYQGKKDFGEKFIKAATTWTTQTTKIALEGDVLMSVRAPVGPVNFATEKSCIGRGLAAIRSGPEMNCEFLFYQLLYMQPEIAGKEGAVFASINKSDIEDMTIAFVPLPEQRRIVGLLDAAFEGIATAKANTEENLRNARAIFESYIESIFTMVGDGPTQRRLSEIAETISTGPFGTMLHKADYVAAGIPLVNPMNIVEGIIVPSSKMMVSQATRKRLASYVLKVGDVVIGRRGELGRCAVVTEREEGWLCGTGSFFVRLTNLIDPEFFVALFSSRRIKAQLEKAAIGATMSNLNHAILNALVLPVPSLSEQRKIMLKAHQLLSETNRLKFVYEHKLEALGALKNSLLHQAFAGKLIAPEQLQERVA